MWWFEHKQQLRASGPCLHVYCTQRHHGISQTKARLERRKYFTALSGDVSPETMRAEVLQYLGTPSCDMFKEFLENTLSWCCDRINTTRTIVVD